MRDLYGQRFGKLTAIRKTDEKVGGKYYWLCQCDCGKLTKATSNNLRSGGVGSCGCGHIKDLTSRRFGRLTVIGMSGEKSRTNYVWDCLCDCGNICSVRGSNLTAGQTKSCGCLAAGNLELGVKRKDLTGEVFYDLFVASYAGRNSKGNSLWNCVCVCGNAIVVKTNHLTTSSPAKVKSCGCRKIRVAKERMSGESHWNWRGGNNLYPLEWNDELQEEIRNRDNRTCQFPDCEYADIGKSRRLDVHHINGDKNNCESANLISMCHKHHMLVEANSPRDWEDYFYEITYDYECAT